MVNSSSFLEDVWHDGHEMLNQICKALGAWRRDKERPHENRDCFMISNWSPRFVVVLLANVLVGHVEMVQILFYYIKFTSM
jgi:hypothetical protein